MTSPTSTYAPLEGAALSRAGLHVGEKRKWPNVGLTAEFDPSRAFEGITYRRRCRESDWGDRVRDLDLLAQEIYI